MKYANIHLHSIYSDGVLTPTELCEKAKEMGYKALAVTDHETVNGYEELKKSADALGLDCILGIETYAVEFGNAFHLTGYDFDTSANDMAKYLKDTHDSAYLIAKAKFDGLVKDGHIKGITFENVLEDFPENCWFCNEQIFGSLVKRTGLTQKDYQKFSKDYKNQKIDVKPTFKCYSAEKMIKVIRDAGGVPMLAHPHMKTQFLPGLLKLGLMGVEYSHPDIDEADSAAAKDFALNHKMYLSGGTDHTGLLSNFPKERMDFDPEYNPTPGTKYNCPMDRDDRSGITEEEFFAIKNRIYG